MTMRKSPMMLEVEEKLGMPLEEVLPGMINELGIAGTAVELKVSKSTINYWMLKLGIHIQRVAVMPGDQLVVKRVA